MSNTRRFTSTHQLEQVLVNLYFNAIAAMSHGGKLWVNTKKSMHPLTAHQQAS
jgi:signal transduction histidine kinase